MSPGLSLDSIVPSSSFSEILPLATHRIVLGYSVPPFPHLHRILAANTIEEHPVKLIEQNTNPFMACAHESAIKDSSKMASDPSTGALERELMRLLEEEQ